MKNKQTIIFIIIAILVAVGSFYGGMLYQQNTANAASQQRRQAFAGSGLNRNGRAGNGNDFVSGTIIAKDDKSITVKLSNDGSKIVFLSDKTQIAKSDPGTVSDLEIGKMVTVSGTANTDGSDTALNIQIRQLPTNPSATPTANQ